MVEHYFLFLIAAKIKKCLIKLLVVMPNCYKIQKICNKAGHTYSSAMQFVPDRYKSEGMCVKAVVTVVCI